MRSAGIRSVAPLALAALLAACTGLPDYAQPRVQQMTAAEYSSTDVIRYRALTRSDFKASQPPVHLGRHVARLGAYTCANIVPVAELGVDIRRSQEPGVFVARLANAVVHAEMDRDCSWWNAENTTLPFDYILQHEQIHFGLTEIRARLVSAELTTIEVRAGSVQEASRAAQQRYDALMARTSQELLEQNRQFDEQTSARYAPQRQAEWMAYVEEQLAATAPSP